jgi:glycosyltransferase involved in cell wall biosynthesis
MRIAVVEPDGAGGLAHYAFQVSTALTEAGAEVTLITSPHWELAHLERQFSVEQTIDLWPAVEDPVGSGTASTLRRLWRKIRRVGRAFRYVWAWEKLTRSLMRSRPDIVQFSSIHFTFQSFFLHRMRRSGLVLTQICHEFELRESRFALTRRIDNRMARSLYRAFSVMFFHGEKTLQQFRSRVGEPSGTVEIIPHGNQALLAKIADAGGDMREHYDLPENPPVVLFFGGLRRSKGLPELINAFSRVRREIEANLLIAGFPATEVDPGRLVEQAARLGVADSVTIDPRYVPLEEVGPLLRTAAVVVLPYRSATASGVLQAAYAFGRPVIVTNVGDLPDSVDEGTTGYVVPAGDEIALARAIVKMTSDRAELRRMGASAKRAAAERYSWTGIAEKILDTYESVL